MKLLPTHLICWSSLLTLFWFSVSQCETEASVLDVCQKKEIPEVRVHSSFPEKNDYKYDVKEDENFFCVIYPTNELNCSWSFHTLPEDTQLSVSRSICNDSSTVEPLHRVSEERVGSLLMNLVNSDKLRVILHFNMSLNNAWKVYSYHYDAETLEGLSPPEISVSVEDGNLLVNWSQPISKYNLDEYCFDYQLDMGDQEEPKILSEEDIRSYTVLNADSKFTYRVRIRTKVNKDCYGSSQWSDWSRTVVIREPDNQQNDFSVLVVILISLGIPMILLSVVLLVRHQRVTDVLFPPIPRPPPKYKCFLEKNDPMNFFYPAPPAKPEEEITEVEDTENPEKPV